MEKAQSDSCANMIVEFPVFELGAIGKGHVGKGFEFELSFL